jgi:hypothetical protein
MTADTPQRSEFLAARAIGYFVRSLVPVRLTNDHMVTFGVWIQLPDQQSMDRIGQLWNASSYLDLVIEGRLANRIAPWDIYGAEVTAVPRSKTEIPFCVASPNSSLQAVLADYWPHDLILSTLPSA